MKLDELKDAYIDLHKQSYAPSDKKNVILLENLKREFDASQINYQNAVYKESQLRVELSVLEKRLTRKEEKIKDLEKNL